MQQTGNDANPQLARKRIRSILGHELFHHIQFAYADLGGSSGCSGAFGSAACEGHARAMQDKIYSDLDLNPEAECTAPFLGQVNSYLASAHLPLWEWKYNSALWWSWLMEQYGTARQLAFGLPDDARLGLIEFAGNNIEPDNDATLRVPLLPLATSQSALLREQIDALTSGVNRFTSIGDAMRLAVQEFSGNAQARCRARGCRCRHCDTHDRVWPARRSAAATTNCQRYRWQFSLRSGRRQRRRSGPGQRAWSIPMAAAI